MFDDKQVKQLAEEVIAEKLASILPQIYETADITNLGDKICKALKCGDIVVKKTGNQRHSYRVSYKENNQGLCLTYCDASCVETVSYDYIEGHWVYNSTDITPLAQ